MRDKSALTAPERAALSLLGIYTNQRFDIGMLTGDGNRTLRANVASAMANRRVSKSMAGYTVLRQLFYDMANVPEDCMAIQESNFIAWAKE